MRDKRLLAVILVLTAIILTLSLFLADDPGWKGRFGIGPPPE